jgi:outer membrane receptor protein involved in Fe transport
VLTPTFVKGLTLSVDYYNIKVKNYINAIPMQLTIDQCIGTGNPFFCSLFNRNPRNGVLFSGDANTAGYVLSTTQNTGSLATSGIDFTADYTFRTAIGALSSSLVGTWLRDLSTEPLPGLASYDCKGLFGGTCGQPSPEWRHQARFTWTSPDDKGSISLNWRYIGPTKVSFNDKAQFPGSATYVINSRLPVANYFDLAATASVTKALTLRAGVNNLLDRDPPAIAQGVLALFGNGNTYPGVYDVAGRSFFVGLSAEF